MNEHSPVSPAQAQKAIGFEGDEQGRKLLRELLAREKAAGVTIVIRRVSKERTRHYVTVAAIRKHAPDLVPNRTTALLREARRYLEEINIRIDERVAEQCERQYQRRIVPELTKIRNHQEQTAEVVEGLSRTVSRLVNSAT